MIKLHRDFLWGGNGESRNICWVAWDNICLPKKEGGFGVKKLLLVDMVLLNKWKWRLLSDTKACWRDLLFFRYGNIGRIITGLESFKGSSKYSLFR